MALLSFSPAFSFRKLSSTFEGRSRTTRRSRRRVLELEAVENRTLLSTLLVSTTGSYNGQSAYLTIQVAVTAAPTSGATIEVAPGSYNGTVAINKSLTLLGAEANVAPTTAGARTNPANESILNGNFAIEASNVTINGFTVQNAKTATGVTDASSDNDTLLEDNIIQNTTLGVSFIGDSNASVTTNRIENAAGDGIDLGDESGDLAEYNLIESNGFTTANGQGSQGQGMLLSTVTSTTLLDNQVLSNHTNGIEVTITSSSVNIHGNAVDSNGAVGIAVQSSSGNWIQSNTVDDNGDQGILLVQTSPDSVDWNTVENNFGNGIEDDDDGGTLNVHNECSYNTVEANGFLNGQPNQSQGMMFSSATYAVVYDNNVSYNHTDGIEVVLYSTGVLVSDNTVDSNGGDGVAVSNTNTGTVEYNNLKSNGADGIHFIGDTKMTIYDNTVANSKLDGIQLDSTSTGNAVEDNTISGSGVYDAEDDSSGSGTAGTANTWTGNTGKTDNHHGGLL